MFILCMTNNCQIGHIFPQKQKKTERVHSNSGHIKDLLLSSQHLTIVYRVQKYTPVVHRTQYQSNDHY